LTLQADKAQLAKAALDGGSVGNLNKLSVKEILYLFKANADA
jgi:SNF2 family DNA or RNA helicase